jgi:hypothetical protein
MLRVPQHKRVRGIKMINVIKMFVRTNNLVVFLFIKTNKMMMVFVFLWMKHSEKSKLNVNKKIDGLYVKF